MSLYPIKFEPFLREMVWGGEKILPLKHLSLPLHRIGESWEISGYPGHVTKVAEGSLKGLSLEELVHTYKEALVGKAAYRTFGDTFPLLVKIIDASSDLSVQVHPNDELAAQRHPGQRGKNEMWYVMQTDPGAALYCGIAREVSREEYQARVADGTITDILARYEVQPGDVFSIPAGRIHAICKGCMLAEIQETSDLTYRIFDYNRPGLDGKPRQLHTAEALDAIDFTVQADYRTHYPAQKNAETMLVRSPWFTTSLLDLDAPFRKDLSGLDSFVVVMCIAGSGTLTDAEPLFDRMPGADGDIALNGADGAASASRPGPTKGHRATLRQGETLLIPATSLGVSFTPDAAGMKLLLSHL